MCCLLYTSDAADDGEDGIRYQPRSRGLGDVYKRQLRDRISDLRNRVFLLSDALERISREQSERREKRAEAILALISILLAINPLMEIVPRSVSLILAIVMLVLALVATVSIVRG